METHTFVAVLHQVRCLDETGRMKCSCGQVFEADDMKRVQDHLLINW